MKVIKQQEEIRFCAISLKDAIIMLPLMDALTKTVNNNRVVDFYNNLPKEEKAKYRQVWHQNVLDIPVESMENILNVLLNLGFESQIGLKDASINDLQER